MHLRHATGIKFLETSQLTDYHLREQVNYTRCVKTKAKHSWKQVSWSVV